MKKAKPTPKTEPTRYTAFRCPLDVLEKAKARAREQRRSLSNYIVTMLEAAEVHFERNE